MKEKFSENFTHINRNHLKNYWNQNVWKKDSQIITSIDFLKQDDILEMIKNEKEGLLIDERNLNGFAKAILRLADDPDLSKNLGNAARTRYLNFYTGKHLENNVRKVFEEHLLEKE